MKKRLYIICGVIIVLLIGYSGFKLWNNRIVGYDKAQKTYDNLNTALKGETTATQKYLQFAEVAKGEGYANVQKLFLVTSDAEQIHVKKEYDIANAMKAMDKLTANKVDVGTSVENLQSCIDGEIYESTVMYPEFVDTAATEKFSKAGTTFKFARDAESSHAVLFKQALEEIKSDSIPTEEVYYFLCPVCGKVERSSSPLFCSVCGTPGMMFTKY